MRCWRVDAKVVRCSTGFLDEYIAFNYCKLCFKLYFTRTVALNSTVVYHNTCEATTKPGLGNLGCQSVRDDIVAELGRKGHCFGFIINFGDVRKELIKLCEALIFIVLSNFDDMVNNIIKDPKPFSIFRIRKLILAQHDDILTNYFAVAVSFQPLFTRLLSWPTFVTLPNMTLSMAAWSSFSFIIIFGRMLILEMLWRSWWRICSLSNFFQRCI